MKLSAKTMYGIRALLDLAHQEPTTITSIQEIGTRQQVSQQFLETIFSLLKQATLVNSVRGSKGGYQLARPIQDITLLDILTALEEPLFSSSETKKDSLGAFVHLLLWKPIDDSIHRFLSSVTLAQLQEESIDSLMYYI